jgi:hypothetical protein
VLLTRRWPSSLRSGRRTFLGIFLWTSIVLRRPRRAFAQSPTLGPLDAASLATLEAVADSIVPRDQDPGALDAGVPGRILAHLATHPSALTLYRAGLGLLEGLARRAGASSFQALDGPGRERILLSLASGSGDSRGLAQEFFIRVRRDVLAFYWGSVVGQGIVGYRPPVAGYPEYADPPARPRGNGQ